MSKTFIAAYDGSDASRAAVEFAVELARAQGAEVSAVHVYPRVAPVGMLRGGFVDHDFQDQLREEGRQLLEGLDVEGVAHKVLIPGAPARALHELAEEEGAALMVVGVTHRRHIGRISPGSVGANLLNGSPCAVCIVPADRKPGPIRRIVVAYDERDQAQVALREAARLARQFGASLEIVAVQEPRVYAGPEGARNTELDEVLHEELGARVRERADAIAGVEVEVTTVIGDAAHTIIEAAKDADLLVCGSRGYGPLRSVLMGGVSRHLVDHAPCPVLVVPRGVADEVAAAPEPGASAQTA
jgi:nucleotide-binding universal stress UspA family protein